MCQCDYAGETALLGIVQLSIVHTTDEGRDLEQDKGAGTTRTETGRIKAAESGRGFVHTWRKLDWSAVYWLWLISHLHQQGLRKVANRRGQHRKDLFRISMCRL